MVGQDVICTLKAVLDAIHALAFSAARADAADDGLSKRATERLVACIGDCGWCAHLTSATGVKHAD